MKTFAMLLGLLLCSSTMAGQDVLHENTLHSESFPATLYAENGAIQCMNRFASHFGSRPTTLFLNNRGGRHSTRLVDAGDRTSRIEFFNARLPDAITCAEIENKLPKGNVQVTASRLVTAKLYTENQRTSLLIAETVQIPLTDSVSLQGTFFWSDFRVPENEVLPNRDLFLQLIDRRDWQESLELQVQPLLSGFKCEKMQIHPEKYRLTLHLPREQTNNSFVGRTFETEDACVDKLTEMIGAISVTNISSLGIAVKAQRKLSLVERMRVGNTGGSRQDLVRVESVSFHLLGVKFIGYSGFPLWPLANP